MPNAIVMGVGPQQGLGARLCQRFAEAGLHVYVAGRTASKLEAVVKLIEAEGGKATAAALDVSDEAAVISLFDKATADAALDLAVYNVGNNTPGELSTMQTDYFIESWRSGCLGGFIFAREAAQRMLLNNKGTILFTGASASLRGRANFGAFNSAKAALRIMAQALAKEIGPRGIHVAHVVIDGAINGEKAKSNFPDYAAKLGDEGLISLEGIVDAYEFLYRQAPPGWSFELDIRTAVENW